MAKRVHLEDLDLSKVKIHPLKTKKYENNQESKSCAITYDNGEKIIVQTPKAVVPFGLTTGKIDDNDKKLVAEGKKFLKYSIEMNIEGAAKDKVEEFDEMAIAFISENSKEWWKKDKKHHSPETVAAGMYGKMIKTTDPDKGDYPDRFKVKLPFYNGEPKFKVYDENNQKINFYKNVNGKIEIDWSWAQAKMQVEIIAEVECLWEVNKKCYVTFKAHQIRVYTPDSLPECAFDDDGEVPLAKPVVQKKKDVKKAPVAVAVEDDEDLKVKDSDDEAEDEEEDSKPKPTKKNQIKSPAKASKTSAKATPKTLKENNDDESGDESAEEKEIVKSPAKVTKSPAKPTKGAAKAKAKVESEEEEADDGELEVESDGEVEAE